MFAAGTSTRTPEQAHREKEREKDREGEREKERKREREKKAAREGLGGKEKGELCEESECVAEHTD